MNMLIIIIHMNNVYVICRAVRRDSQKKTTLAGFCFIVFIYAQRMPARFSYSTKVV